MLLQITMFCKICFDSKNDSYTTHCIRDFNGNITCPILLNTKCNLCGNFGHTKKYCSKNNYDYKPKVTINAPVTLKETFNKNKLTITNQFNLLCEDSDDSDNNDFLDLNDIIWGVGFKSMIGVSWADECGA